MYNLRTLVESVNANCAAIMKPHPTKPFFYCFESFHVNPDWKNIKNPIDSSTNNGIAYTTGKPVLKEHIDKEYVGHFLSSVLVVPIVKDMVIQGTLEIIITDQTKSFPPDAIKKAQEFAKLIAGTT